MIGRVKYMKRRKRNVENSAFPLSNLPSFRSSSGFTLIELLVALALLGILGASLAGVLRNAVDSVDQAQVSVDQLTRLRSLEMILGGAVRDAVDLSLTFDKKKMLADTDAYETEEGAIRFRGEAQALGFCLQRPFLSAERDGYMHWILLEIIADEETERFSLRLRDISFIPGIDNPAGEDWGGLEGDAVEHLPVQEIYLIRDASALAFTYWYFPEDNPEEAEEMEPEDLAGDYAAAVPDYINLEIKLPKCAAETMTFDYSIRRNLF